MVKNLILDTLISEFIEKISSVDVNIINNNSLTFYKDIIRNIADYLKIGKVTLVYECSQIHTNLLIHKKSLYSNELNILYDSFKMCDGSQIVSFSYSQNDGNYTLNFIRIAKCKVWDDSIISKLKIISNLSFSIISRLKLSEISQASEYYDYSTGVLNNNGIISALIKLCEENIIENYFCTHINIKHFKTFNIQYSYSGGNEILKKFADYMYNYLGDIQPFGHLGEDNFIAIVKKSNMKNFLDYVDNINLSCNNDNIHLELYIGMYEIQNSDDVSTILNNSATAFNLARNTPNCRYMKFTEEMHKQAIEIKHIEDIMHEALKNNEFITYYQPKICLNEFNLVGAEALVRWQKDNTLIPPYKFIPVFENNGFITEIDFCMLRNVCQSIKTWISNGIEPVTVSVNFSKLHLSNPNFVSQIKETINRYKISPKYIEIEFTETLDVENYNSLVQINRELKKYGFKTSIDDFGAGFSSLNMLKDVPVDVVKLDKSLIDDTASSTREKIIIQDIVKLAKTLDIEVIAEGVEDLTQLVFLKNIKCNQIQGYVFDKPLCLKDFEERLKNKDYYKKNPKFKDFIKDNYSNENTSVANYGKYTLDLDTYKILNFNNGFCNIIGYSKDELLNSDLTIENFITCNEVDNYMNDVILTLKSMGEVCQEHQMIKKNGTKIYVMCLGMLKSDNTAEFMISDISINKVMERENSVLKSHFDFSQQELKDKNYMFEQIIKNLSGGFGIFAIPKDMVLETVFISNSFCNIFNCKRSKLDRFKNNMFSLIAPCDVDRLSKDIDNCINNKITILEKYKVKSIFNSDITKEVTFKIKSIDSKYNDAPMIYIIMAEYDSNKIELELIEEISKISLLTEYSNLNTIPIQENDFPL